MCVCVLEIVHVCVCVRDCACVCVCVRDCCIFVSATCMLGS